WGGWTTMLLGLDHPQRIDRMIVVCAPHTWPRMRATILPELWRGWYATALATPGLGPVLHRRTGFAKGILRRASPPGTSTAEELDAYADSFRAPERARAMSALYRYYHSGFLRAYLGAWRDRRLTPPTLLLAGGRDLYVTPKLIEVGWEPHADQMSV